MSNKRKIFFFFTTINRYFGCGDLSIFSGRQISIKWLTIFIKRSYVFPPKIFPGPYPYTRRYHHTDDWLDPSIGVLSQPLYFFRCRSAVVSNSFYLSQPTRNSLPTQFYVLGITETFNGFIVVSNSSASNPALFHFFVEMPNEPHKTILCPFLSIYLPFALELL